MAAIANGMAYHGGIRPYTATFFCFSDYMRPAVRLAALCELPVVHVWTHDSVAVGEDGPTHQPVEHLMALRTIPGLSMVRPADANEAAEAWRAALLHRDGPVGLVLTRQDLPVLDVAPEQLREGVTRGAYAVAGPAAGRIDALLLATGSEVHLALAAQRLLAQEGIQVRVVSMPCWEWFAAQPPATRDAVLPPSVRARVSVEAGVTIGWDRWIGEAGVAVGVDRFGASAPGETVQEQLGLTPARVADAVRESMRRAAR
jgi:transketolase